jgi:hypothetical protein
MLGMIIVRLGVVISRCCTLEAKKFRNIATKIRNTTICTITMTWLSQCVGTISPYPTVADVTKLKYTACRLSVSASLKKPGTSLFPTA